MNPAQIFLWLFGGVMALGMVTMLLTRRVIYAGFALFLVLAGNCALFILAGADFLGVAQLIIYVGGILVLLLFGVMLTNRLQSGSPRTGLIQVLPTTGVAAALLAVGWLVFGPTFGGTPGSFSTGQVQGAKPLGQLMLTEFLVAFELASVFLLLALIGAGYLARRSNERNPTA
jgi:NADH-quinone oxidoreductase subunit J